MLSDFNDTRVFWMSVRKKTLKYKISWKSIQRSRGVTFRQTDTQTWER